MNLFSIFYRFLIVSFFFSTACTNTPGLKQDEIRILILSGKNNHEWQKTTPVLRSIFNKAGLFRINITERPDTLDLNDYRKYDVIVSNWNTWPDNQLRWNKQQEDDFVKYIHEGGGAVFIHAGASSFYGWDDYHKIGIGRWGDKTSHGKPVRAKVIDLNQDHPITSGINDFYIMDEIWENIDIHPSAHSLAKITATSDEDGHPIEGASVFINKMGKGRSFYTILGHDERALFNTGLQTLILRGTEWAATEEVTIEVPPELIKSPASAEENFSWIQTDTTLQLLKNSIPVWQYNFRNRFGKNYFHPLYLNRIRLTCESPVDHPWHLGLWYTWKFIDGKNYWEYMNDFKSEETGFRSEGVTSLKNIMIKKNPDYSADIQLDFEYHPIGELSIMEEKRTVHISPPAKDGSYYIDYELIFSALKEEVVLDRTPILGEPDGKSWGGYGGLSIRCNQDFTSADFLPELQDVKYPTGDWFYLGPFFPPVLKCITNSD